MVLMDELKTISAITGDLPVVAVSGLQVWYNNLLSKTEKEIGIKDVLIMLRQNIYLDIARNRATELLEINPFIGEVCDCELLSYISRSNLKEWSDNQLIKIKCAVNFVSENMEFYDWKFDEDRFETYNVIKILLNKLQIMDN